MAGVLNWLWPGNPLSGGGATPSPLLNGLVSYWKLEETSGTRNDSKGTNHLTDNNTVGYDTGKSGNAASLVGTNAEKLDVTWSLDGTSFTVAYWTAGPYPSYAGPDIRAGETTSHAIYHYLDNTSGGRIDGAVYDSVSGSASFSQTGLGSWSGWNLIVVGYESSTKRGFSSINGAAKVYSSALTNGIKTSGINRFTMGYNPHTGSDDLVIDEMGVWSVVLTDVDIAELYNAGAGKFYPF